MSGAQDEDPHAFAHWSEVARLEGALQASDVAFASSGRNVLVRSRAAWIADAKGGGVVVTATWPIEETADAGEMLDRRAQDLVARTQAVAITEGVSYLLGQDGSLTILRPDSKPTTHPLGPRPLDLAVGFTGLVYVLLDTEVRVYSDPPGTSPLWSFPLDRDLLPAVSLAVTSAGRVFVAGEGEVALGVYDFDTKGQFVRIHKALGRDLGVGRAGGVALVPAVVLPLEDEEGFREGWVLEDRFVVLSDRKERALLVLRPATLEIVGRWELGSELPNVIPGRLDVSNRGQVAIVDPSSSLAYALPTRVLAGMLDPEQIRWRIRGHHDHDHESPPNPFSKSDTEP